MFQLMHISFINTYRLLHHHERKAKTQVKTNYIFRQLHAKQNQNTFNKEFRVFL